MNSISSTATAPVQSTFTPPAASSPVRQGVKDLAKALHAEDLTAAKEAYARIVRTAPEGTKWPQGSTFESLGRALQAFGLPDQITDETIAGAVGQAHEDHHRPWGMTAGRDHDDAAVTPDIVAARITQIGTTVEAVVAPGVWQRVGQLGHAVATVDEVVFDPGHLHGHTGKVSQAADVVPMRMGQQDPG